MWQHWLVGLCAISLLTGSASADKAKDDKKAQEVLDKKLTELKAPKGDLAAVSGDALTKHFGSFSFFALRYPQYPVARVPAEPLKSNNVFVIDGDKVTLVTEPKELEKFFLANAPAVKGDKTGIELAQIWLRFSQQLHNDGFYKFETPKDGFKSVGTDDEPQSSLSVTGKSVVVEEGGNKGSITVTLEFKKGKLASIKEEVKLTPGMRPKCQATKLLDEDPIVRYMAEQSIVIMGRACKPYLDEQRAKASPELQKAIDRMWQRILDEDR